MSNISKTSTTTTTNFSLAQSHYNNMLLAAQAAQAWTEGVYKQSNDELYTLLNCCYEIAKEIRTQSTQVVRELNKILMQNGIAFNEGTRIETKVVRVVFGNIGKRAQIYSRVLVNAREQSVASENFAAWLREKGGVEAVRKVHKGLTPAELKKQRKETSEECLQSIAGKELAQAPKHDNSDFTVAIVYHSKEGARIVAYCKSISVINAALTYVADEAKTEADKVKTAEVEAEHRTLMRMLTQAQAQQAKVAA